MCPLSHHSNRSSRKLSQSQLCWELCVSHGLCYVSLHLSKPSDSRKAGTRIKWAENVPPSKLWNPKREVWGKWTGPKILNFNPVQWLTHELKCENKKPIIFLFFFFFPLKWLSSESESAPPGWLQGAGHWNCPSLQWPVSWRLSRSTASGKPL
jgi:hypothetical protein